MNLPPVEGIEPHCAGIVWLCLQVNIISDAVDAIKRSLRECLMVAQAAVAEECAHLSD
jgi:hypothetical protein